MKVKTLCTALVLVLAATSAAGAATLTPFKSDTELSAYLRKLVPKPTLQKRQHHEGMIAMSPPAPAPVAESAAAAPMAKQAMASADAAESITNVQVAGVDEGGIVKQHGRHLVILRRGRLFTVDVGGDRLKPVSMLNAYAPGAEAQGDWYDEMLISGNTVVVIGYSYARGGTEIGLFDIEDGRLAYRSTYHMRSNDYYSSRNYASRLVGNKLIFYTPLGINPWRDDLFGQFPAVRRWRDGAAQEFRRIAPAQRIYRAGDDFEPHGITLHTVTTCTIERADLDCRANAVLGPRGRVFHVSESAVYVWTAGRSGRSNVFRMPLDGAAPGALRTTGAPVDQFSFHESAGQLNVMVRQGGRGDGMWAAERPAGGQMLLRVPLRSFGDIHASASPRDYTPLPSTPGYSVQNRFVGQHLLYGAGTILYALRWDRPEQVVSFALEHAPERIEVMGSDALVAGSAGTDLHFTGIKLDGMPTLGQRHVQRNAAQAESRSHGFFYKASGRNDGIAALPVLGHNQASILYLRNDGEQFHELGALHSRLHGGEVDDRCVASCVDWYGNARPLFLGGRVFALLGYELVEGRVRDGRIGEVRRASFSPVQR
jgi:hypothetical protein